MIRPGTTTDELTHARSAEIVRRDGFAVIHTREFAGYHGGNCLVYVAPRAPSDLPTIQRHWRAELGVRSDVGRFLVAWEGGEAWPAGSVADAFAPKAETVNLLGTLTAPDRTATVECRPLVTSADWDAASSVAVSQVFERFPGEELFTSWRYRAHRERCDAGDARWWGAFRDDELVGSAGLYESPAWARFQLVQTRIAERNQGICTTLLQAMTADLRARRPATPLVLVSQPGSQAERIYHRLGFEPVGVQWEISAPLSALSAPG